MSNITIAERFHASTNLLPGDGPLPQFPRHSTPEAVRSAPSTSPTKYLNPGISDPELRASAASAFSRIPVLQEIEGDESVDVFFDDLAERYGDETAAALRRAGHHVRLSE